MRKEATHKVVITATSYRDEPNVRLEVAYGPLGDDGTEGDYMPAAYEFVQRALLGAAGEATGPIEYEQGDLNDDRSIN